MNHPRFTTSGCAHCAKAKDKTWHLLCPNCWEILPERNQNELIESHSEMVNSDRHHNAIDAALRALQVTP